MQSLMILLMFFLARPPQRIETQHPDRTKVMRVETAMNHLTVIELAEPVTLAAAGSTSFKIERRENKVFIQPLEEGVSTNLFVWTHSGRSNYELVPAVSPDTMLFAIDQQSTTPSEIPEPVVPAVGSAPIPSIAEEMLLFAKPIRNRGKAGDSPIDVFITDVYRKGDQLFVRYVVDNRTTHPYVVGQPKVFALQSAHSSTSLYALRYSQVGRELQRKIRSHGQLKIASVECDVPSEPLPAGEAATGIFILQAPPTTLNSEPAVLRFVFATAGQQPTTLTLIL
jgi:hypothetical protein